MTGGRPFGYIQGVVELSSGLPKTSPASGIEDDLKLGLPDYKSSDLTTRPRSSCIAISAIVALQMHNSLTYLQGPFDDRVVSSVGFYCSV